MEGRSISDNNQRIHTKVSKKYIYVRLCHTYKQRQYSEQYGDKVWKEKNELYRATKTVYSSISWRNTKFGVMELFKRMTKVIKK